MSEVRDLPTIAHCTECGMPCEAAEYHPYAACLMYMACHDSETVRANLPDIAPGGRDEQPYGYLVEADGTFFRRDECAFPQGLTKLYTHPQPPSAPQEFGEAMASVDAALSRLPRPKTPSAPQADGWQLVPKEPTTGMVCAAIGPITSQQARDAYDAMLRAAPSSPPQAAARRIQHAAHHEHWEDSEPSPPSGWRPISDEAVRAIWMMIGHRIGRGSGISMNDIRDAHDNPEHWTQPNPAKAVVAPSSEQPKEQT